VSETPIQGDDDGQCQACRGGERAEPRFFSGRGQSGLGGRYHVRGYPGGVAVSGRGTGFGEPASGGVGDVQPDEERIDDGGVADGDRAAESVHGATSPFGSRESVHGGRLSTSSPAPWNSLQHESKRGLLGQCRNGEFLGDVEKGTDPPIGFQDP